LLGLILVNFFPPIILPIKNPPISEKAQINNINIRYVPLSPLKDSAVKKTNIKYIIPINLIKKYLSVSLYFFFKKYL